MKALGRGISAPPGLRSFSFRVGCVVPPQQQEQLQPNVQQLEVRAPPVWYSSSSGSGGSSSGSSINGSVCGSGSVDLQLHAPAPEAQRWMFALLQPAPGLMSALCVERRDACTAAPAAGAPGQPLGATGLRLLSFEAMPWSGEERATETPVLAVGQFDP